MYVCECAMCEPERVRVRVCMDLSVHIFLPYGIATKVSIYMYDKLNYWKRNFCS